MACVKANANARENLFPATKTRSFVCFVYIIPRPRGFVYILYGQEEISDPCEIGERVKSKCRCVLWKKKRTGSASSGLACSEVMNFRPRIYDSVLQTNPKKVHRNCKKSSALFWREKAIFQFSISELDKLHHASTDISL